MSKTLGLALGSGGGRGIAHIGILVALEEAGIKPNFISGCSMGAVVGGCYAAGMSAHEIRDIALRLKVRDIVDLGPSLVSRMALLRSKKVEELLHEYLGDLRIEDMPVPFSCVATDLISGKLHVFNEGIAELAVQASCAIPGVFRPVEHDNMLLVDGGCLCRVPVKSVKDMGADVVVAVDVLSNVSEPVEKVGNILSLLLRVFDLMDANQTDMRSQLEGNIADIVIKPVISDVSQYAIKELDKTYEIGYELGKQYVEKIRTLIA